MRCIAKLVGHFLSQTKSKDEAFMDLGLPTVGAFLTTVRYDLSENRRDPKSQSVLVFFRFCQYLLRDSGKPRLRALPFVAVYRLWTEFFLSMELRPKTIVGPGLTIYHGYSLVVNDQTVIGKNVVLRNGVVLGHKYPGGGCPVLRDGVIVGAGAIILGPVIIGEDACIGAGAVVVHDVSPGETVVGNPARPVNRS